MLKKTEKAQRLAAFKRKKLRNGYNKMKERNFEKKKLRKTQEIIQDQRKTQEIIQDHSMNLSEANHQL